ncbi:MAG: hypothetical protein AAB893_01435 [Patescibacteria group bacterium]
MQENGITCESAFNPSGFMNEHGMKRCNLLEADYKLGTPIVGYKNQDGHALFLYTAHEIAKCRSCDVDKGNHIIEEVDHTGNTESYAHYCRNCVPDSMWPQGD